MGFMWIPARKSLRSKILFVTPVVKSVRSEVGEVSTRLPDQYLHTHQNLEVQKKMTPRGGRGSEDEGEEGLGREERSLLTEGPLELGEM